MEQEKDLDYSRSPLPFTAEEAEDQLISLAYGLAMKRLRDETASNQLIAEVLKLGTTKERLQKEKLKKENELLRARTEALNSQKSSEEFYSKVLNALHSYAPSIYNPDVEDDYDEY